MYKAVLDELEAQATGAVPTGTAAGPVQQLLYPAKLNFPGANLEIEFGSVIDVDLRRQSISGQNVAVGDRAAPALNG